MVDFSKDSQDTRFNLDKLNVVLFVSRNKDNKHLETFKERKVSFVTTKDFEEIKSQFQVFINEGQVGEFSRMYISVNPRSNSKNLQGFATLDVGSRVCFIYITSKGSFSCS
jgi:hypothetical protein